MGLIAAFIIGILFGAIRAKRRGGRLADMAQYGAVFGIVFFIVTLMVSVIADNFI